MPATTDKPDVSRELARYDELARLIHKINNPLTAVMGRAQLLQAYEQADRRVIRAAEVIEHSAQRLAACLRELADVVGAGKDEALREFQTRNE